MLEDGVQERERVADGLGLEPFLEHRGGQRLDLSGRHVGDAARAKARADVHTLH